MFHLVWARWEQTLQHRLRRLHDDASRLYGYDLHGSTPALYQFLTALIKQAKQRLHSELKVARRLQSILKWGITSLHSIKAVLLTQWDPYGNQVVERYKAQQLQPYLVTAKFFKINCKTRQNRCLSVFFSFLRLVYIKYRMYREIKLHTIPCY